jgi:hypothetical protein
MWSGFSKVFAKIIAGIVIFLVVSILFQLMDPAGLDYWAVLQAHALLSTDAKPSHLPQEVEFRIDGVYAKFYRDDKDYPELVKLLRHGDTQKKLDEDYKATGKGFYLPGSIDCGEMVITVLGYPSYFRIVRDGNTRIYWIWIRSLHYPGHNIPLFTADPHVIAFIKSHAKP